MKTQCKCGRDCKLVRSKYSDFKEPLCEYIEKIKNKNKITNKTEKITNWIK